MAECTVYLKKIKVHVAPLKLFSRLLSVAYFNKPFKVKYEALIEKNIAFTKKNKILIMKKKKNRSGKTFILRGV